MDADVRRAMRRFFAGVTVAMCVNRIACRGALP